MLATRTPLTVDTEVRAVPMLTADQLELVGLALVRHWRICPDQLADVLAIADQLGIDSPQLRKAAAAAKSKGGGS